MIQELSLFAAVSLLGGFIVSWAFSRRGGQVINMIPGPPPSSWWYGNLPELLLAPYYGQYEFKWQAKYGELYRVNGCMGEKRLMVSDHSALRYILNDPVVFVRSSQVRQISWILTGKDGIFSVNDQTHRRLRNVMNTVLSPANARNLIPVLRGVSHKLVEKVEVLCDSERPFGGILDLYELLQNATLDVVGQAALGYAFDAVEDNSRALASSHYNVLAIASSRSRVTLIGDRIMEYLPQFVFKAALLVPTPAARSLRRFKEVMARLSTDLVRSKTEALTRGLETERDCLSAIVETNHNIQGPGRLTETEICNQVPSLLVAGQDTSGNVLSWALYEFARRPEWQERVRTELSVASARAGGELGHADLESLACLNAHLKETLRIYPGVPLAERVATQEAVIPLSQPVVSLSGDHITELRVEKGQLITCAIASYNRNPALWGSDAHEFNPERWLRERPAKKQSLGPYGNILSFIAGPYTCIGWRFAIIELQVILADLICKFTFELPDDVVIRTSLAVTLLPVSDTGKPNLPLKVRPLE